MFFSVQVLHRKMLCPGRVLWSLGSPEDPWLLMKGGLFHRENGGTLGMVDWGSLLRVESQRVPPF